MDPGRLVTVETTLVGVRNTGPEGLVGMLVGYARVAFDEDEEEEEEEVEGLEEAPSILVTVEVMVRQPVWQLQLAVLVLVPVTGQRELEGGRVTVVVPRRIHWGTGGQWVGGQEVGETVVVWV